MQICISKPIYDRLRRQGGDGGGGGGGEGEINTM